MVRKLGIIAAILFTFLLCYMFFGMALALHMASIYKGQAGYCKNVALPYERIWIVAEVLLAVILLLYLVIVPAFKRNIFSFKFNQYLILILLLNLAAMVFRCFQYPFVIKNTGLFHSVTTTEMSHPFMIISVVFSLMLIYFVAKYKETFKLFVPVNKNVLYAILGLCVVAVLYLKLTAVYVTCFG